MLGLSNFADVAAWLEVYAMSILVLLVDTSILGF